MRQKTLPLLLMVIMVVSTMGCVSATGTPLKKVFQTQKGRVLENYLQEGRGHEEKGDLVEALKNYKIALSIDPANKAALHSRHRLEALLGAAAKEHFAKGVELQGEGKYGEARRQFLIALRLRPDDPEAIKILTARKRVFVERYVVHEIKPGESLSRLAMIYYGDSRLFSVIARYNNLIDATRIHVGEKIKVPEIEGIVFLAPKEGIETKADETSPEAFSDWVALEDLLEQPVDGGFQEEGKESADQVAYHREHGLEFFDEGRYQEAIFEFSKVLSVRPDDDTAKEYTSRSYYQTGMVLFENKDYLGAKEQFLASLRYKSECQECHDYIKRSDDLYKEMHYKLGIQYYGKEQLDEAIKEWELVRELEPNYKRVEYYINKADSIQKKLQELRKE